MIYDKLNSACSSHAQAPEAALSSCGRRHRVTFDADLMLMSECSFHVIQHMQPHLFLTANALKWLCEATMSLSRMTYNLDDHPRVVLSTN